MKRSLNDPGEGALPSAEAPHGSREPLDLSATVAAAREARERWSEVPLSRRLAIVRRFRGLLAEESRLLAAQAARGGNRATSEVLASEVIPLADACRFLERRAVEILAPRRHGVRGRPLWLVGESATIEREPHGLVLIIAPSNYPLFLPGVQTLQALVAGNAVLLKPGRAGSETAASLRRLLQAAGLPGDLVHLLPEESEAARAAIESGIDKVIFTGSAPVGARVLGQLAPWAIPSVMELSGCDAAFIRADADLAMAVQALVFGMTLNSGRTCIAPRRAFVARSVATEFEGRLVQALARRATQPDSRAANPEYSSQNLFLPRLGMLARQAMAEGAHLLYGSIADNDEVTAPVVLGGICPSSPLLNQDFFAPVLCMVTVTDDEEALAFARNCPYALGATIFGRDLDAARALARRIDAGVVVINDMIAPTADPRLPFSGRRKSGFGATRGPEGLLEMTRLKVVIQRRGSSRAHFFKPARGDGALFEYYLQLAHGMGLGKRWRALKNLVSAGARRGQTTSNE